MKASKMQGIYQDKRRIFTENFCKGEKVYNEKLVKFKGKEYRSWNPYRSKLAAAILNGFNFMIESDMKILYLGAASGTTVSHISDIVKDGLIYAVESSPVAAKSLIGLSSCPQVNVAQKTRTIPVKQTVNNSALRIIIPPLILCYSVYGEIPPINIPTE